MKKINGEYVPSRLLFLVHILKLGKKGVPEAKVRAGVKGYDYIFSHMNEHYEEYLDEAKAYSLYQRRNGR